MICPDEFGVSHDYALNNTLTKTQNTDAVERRKSSNLWSIGSAIAAFQRAEVLLKNMVDCIAITHLINSADCLAHATSVGST